MNIYFYKENKFLTRDLSFTSHEEEENNFYLDVVINSKNEEFYIVNYDGKYIGIDDMNVPNLYNHPITKFMLKSRDRCFVTEIDGELYALTANSDFVSLELYEALNDQFMEFVEVRKIMRQNTSYSDLREISSILPNESASIRNLSLETSGLLSPIDKNELNMLAEQTALPLEEEFISSTPLRRNAEEVERFITSRGQNPEERFVSSRNRSFEEEPTEQRFTLSRNLPFREERSITSRDQNFEEPREQRFITSRDQSFEEPTEQRFITSRDQSFEEPTEQRIITSRSKRPIEESFTRSKRFEDRSTRSRNLEEPVIENFVTSISRNLENPIEENFVISRNLSPKEEFVTSRSAKFITSRDKNLRLDEPFITSRDKNLRLDEPFITTRDKILRLDEPFITTRDKILRLDEPFITSRDKNLKESTISSEEIQNYCYLTINSALIYFFIQIYDDESNYVDLNEEFLNRIKEDVPNDHRKTDFILNRLFSLLWKKVSIFKSDLDENAVASLLDINLDIQDITNDFVDNVLANMSRENEISFSSIISKIPRLTHEQTMCLSSLYDREIQNKLMYNKMDEEEEREDNFLFLSNKLCKVSLKEEQEEIINDVINRYINILHEFLISLMKLSLFLKRKQRFEIPAEMKRQIKKAEMEIEEGQLNYMSDIQQIEKLTKEMNEIKESYNPKVKHLNEAFIEALKIKEEQINELKEKRKNIEMRENELRQRIDEFKQRKEEAERRDQAIREDLEDVWKIRQTLFMTYDDLDKNKEFYGSIFTLFSK
jgi:hypothetical protein